SKGRLRCTPTSTPGHAASNCTLPPKIVHGVDQATTGMVRPVHVCCGVVFHATPVDGVDGVPALRKRCASVQPHRFTCLRHRAGAAVQSDRTPAAANFVHLLFICKPPSPPRRCSLADHSAELTWSWEMLCPMVTRLRQLRPRTSAMNLFLGPVCRNAVTPTH